MIPKTAVDLRVARHEAAHAAAAYLILGPDAVLSVTRTPGAGYLGKAHTTIPTDLLYGKDPALLAADCAVVLLAAVRVEPGDRTLLFNANHDVQTVYDRLAPIAYKYAGRVEDVEAWVDAWVAQIGRRVDELLDSSKLFWRCLNPLESAMDLSPSLSGENVRLIFAKALRS